MKLVEYRKIAKNVQADLTAALAKHGLKLKPFGARIDERLGIVTMKLECADVNHKAADGSSTTPEAELFKQYAGLYDLKPEWLGQTFTVQGKEYRVTGMKRRGTKNICITRVSDDQALVTTPESVSRAFIAADVKRAG